MSWVGLNLIALGLGAAYVGWRRANDWLLLGGAGMIVAGTLWTVAYLP